MDNSTSRRGILGPCRGLRAPGSDFGFGDFLGGERAAVVALGLEPLGKTLFEDFRAEQHQIANRFEAARVILVLLSEKLRPRHDALLDHHVGERAKPHA